MSPVPGEPFWEYAAKWLWGAVGLLVGLVHRANEKRSDKQDADIKEQFDQVWLELRAKGTEVNTLRKEFSQLKVGIAEQHSEVLNNIAISRAEIIHVVTENQRQSDKAMAAQTLEFTKALNAVGNRGGPRTGD